MEKLAFPIVTKGEADLPEVWSEPLNTVLRTLEKYETYMEVGSNLPDVEIVLEKKKR